MSNGEASLTVLVCDDREEYGEHVASALENIVGIKVTRIFGKARDDENEREPSLAMTKMNANHP